MTYGLGALGIRLDAVDTAHREATEFDWTGFSGWMRGTNWTSGQGPRFAIRNFMTGQFQCAMAEPAQARVQMTAAGMPALERIVPLARPDPTRLATAGDDGYDMGDNDARVLCERIGSRIAAGEFDIPQRLIYVYLDVPAGAVLSRDYWAGWATAVQVYQLTRTIDRPFHGMTMPTLQMSQPFLPAICAPFEQDPETSKWSLAENVKTCLDGVAAAYPAKHVRCFGFWAKATDPARQVMPTAPLDWSQFVVYDMAVSPGGSQPVWILGWRFTEQATIPDATFAAGLPISLDATHEGSGGQDVSFDRMLTINGTWTVAEANASEWGFDCSVSTETQITCLRTQTVYDHNISFVARYSDTFTGGHHHLDEAERAALEHTMFHRVIVWEGRRTDAAGNVLWPNGSAYFGQSFGYQDGRDAFARGANIIRQGPHSPVYFAVDFDALQGDAANIRRYFTEIERAHTDYLADQRTQKLDPVPFTIGVYGPIFALELCYRQGICSHFWQAFGGGFSGGRNRNPFPHDNMFQRSNSAATHDTLCGIDVDFDIGWGDVGWW